MAVPLARLQRRLCVFLLVLTPFLTKTSSQTTTDCGGSYTTDQGSFDGGGGNCVWTIQTPDPEKSILLELSDMQFEREYCFYDYVEVRDGLTAQGNLLAGACGAPSLSVLSNGNRLYIRLHQSYSSSSLKFRASWSSVCQRNLTNPSGVIRSPGFPGQYSNNLDCTYVIEQPRGYTINLMFTEFSLDVPAASGNCVDFIEVYDGPSVKFPRLGRGKFCGNISPGLLQSSGHTLFIKFQTDTTRRSNGFNATYTRITPTCPQGTALSEQGNIVSPSFPQPYPEQGVCTWTIKVARLHVVEFTFHVLALGNNTDRLLDCDDSTVVFELSLLNQNQFGIRQLLERLCHKTTVSQKFVTVSQRSEYDLIVNFTTKRSAGSAYQYQDIITGFNASYTTRASASNAGDETCPVLHFGGHLGGTYLREQTPSLTHTVPVKIDLGVPVGPRRFEFIHIHKDGRLMFSDQNTGFRPRDSRVCSGGQPHLCAYCTPSLNRNTGDPLSGVQYKQHKPSDAVSRSVISITNDYIGSFKGANFTLNVMLLVTWNRMRMGNMGNATFQAAIAVSGNESYAVVSYTEVNVFPEYQPVINIGYSPTTNNLDQCQELLFSKTKQAFDIAKKPGNSGCLGVWVYKLGEAPSNLSTECDIWYNRNLARNQSRWAQFDNLPKCPCRDEAGNVRNGAYGIWISAGIKSNRIKCYRLSRSAGNDFFPHGKECCYVDVDPYNGNLVQNQPDAATATAFNPSFPALRRQHLTEDKLGYDFCCSKNNPSDCAKYYSLRPIGKCDPKPPIQFSWLCCDPYFLTLDEEEYLFNGWGEYTLVNLTIHRFSFILQARTDLAETDTGTLTNATIFSAFGAQENDVRVFVQLDPNTKAALIIFVNDEDYSRRFKNDPDFILDEDDVLLQRKNNTVQIALPSGISFGVSLRTKSLEVSVGVPKFFQNKTRGLLGNFNGVQGDDFLLPNGTLMTPRPSERQIFDVFGPAWAVTANNSVMRYGPREGPSDYFHPEFVPIFLDEQTETVRNASRDLCGKNLACIYDYIATGSETFAMESKAIKENADETNEALNNAVPVLDPPSVLRVASGTRVNFRLRGSDLDGDTLTYHNVTYNSGVELNSVTGDVSYLGDKNVPVELSFYAMDSRVRSTTRFAQVVICDCKNNGSCDYNTLQPSESTVSYYFRRAACVCPPAWVGEECELDRDGCELSPCLKQQNCTDLTPQQQGSSDIGFSCGPCPPGYKQRNGSTECLDVDECAAGSSVHSCQMTCSNTEGSYECGCGPGYRLTNDGRTCQDVNECEEKIDNCDQMCHNDAGGFRCSCEQGYDLQSDGNTCSQNVTLDLACRYAGCSQGCRLATDSVSGVEILQCFCFAGYDKDPEDDAACIDHDECRDNVPCSQQCYNYDGGFACTCDIGYHLAEDKVTCLPCPKLSYGVNCQYTCSCNGRGLSCDPVRGCVCEKGWTGSECQEDVNECRENPDICGSEVQCVNTLGAYLCKCRDGYSQSSDGMCTDIDECGEDSLLNNCTSLQRCVNFQGGFTCECLPGYVASGGDCVDNDECSANVSQCQQLCSNTKGSYNCDCYYGYRLNADRFTCTQVTNKCAAEQDLSCAQGCSLDDDDSPFCFCDLGFSLNADGRNCDRILTCSNFGCSHVCNATARDLACSCPAGMILENDMKTCKVLPGLETCVQFEAKRPCPVDERCVQRENGPVCVTNTTRSETSTEDESSVDALVIGLSVGIPLAVIAIVVVVVVVIKQRKKDNEPVESPYATLSRDKEPESQYTTLHLR